MFGWVSSSNWYVELELYCQTRCKTRCEVTSQGGDLWAFGQIEFCIWVIGVKTAVFSPRWPKPRLKKITTDAALGPVYCNFLFFPNRVIGHSKNTQMTKNLMGCLLYGYCVLMNQDPTSRLKLNVAWFLFRQPKKFHKKHSHEALLAAHA